MIFWSLLTGFLLSHFADVLVYQKHPTTTAMLKALADPRSGLSSMFGFAGGRAGLFCGVAKTGNGCCLTRIRLRMVWRRAGSFGRMGCYVAHDHPGELLLTSDPLTFWASTIPCPQAHCAPRGTGPVSHRRWEFRRHDMGFARSAVRGARRWLFCLGSFCRGWRFVASIATLYGPIALCSIVCGFATESGLIRALG